MSDFENFMVYKMATEDTGGSGGCGCGGCVTSVILAIGAIFLFVYFLI